MYIVEVLRIAIPCMYRLPIELWVGLWLNYLIWRKWPQHANMIIFTDLVAYYLLCYWFFVCIGISCTICLLKDIYVVLIALVKHFRVPCYACKLVALSMAINRLATYYFKP
jgi:hypothetical protein